MDDDEHHLVVQSFERIHRDPDDIPLARSHRAFARAATTLEADVTPNLVLRLLGAAECHATNGDDARACDLFLPSGRIGAELGFSQVTLLANVGRYARVPTLGELFGVSGVIRGNANLDPEQGYTAEVGVRAQIGHFAPLGGLAVDAFAYVRAADDLIAYLRAAQGYVAPYNVGSARVMGAEVALSAPLLSFLRLETALTLEDPRDTSRGRTTVNGVEGNTLQTNTRAGLTLALPVDRNNSVKVYASTGTFTRTGSDFNGIGFAWQYRWGGGF